jgi:release factor glutamine methyltransferase
MSTRTEPFEYNVANMGMTVLPKVYPGSIDSELTANAIGNTSNKSVLDLCTGTGIVALKATQQGASRVMAVDLNSETVKNIKLNAKKFGYDQIEVREGLLFEPVGDEKFDVIAINPPYTDKEPSDKTKICFWNEDNKTAREFIAQYKFYLNSGGKAFLAWADFSSIEPIQELARDNHTKLELVQSKSTPSGLAIFLVYQLVDL